MYLKIVVLSLLVSSISACGMFSGTSIPVVDMPTSNNCGTDKAAYVYPNAKFAVCIDERLANFMYCVNAFSLSSISDVESSKYSINVGEFKELIDAASFKDEEKRDLIQNFARGGAIEEARAEAMDTCKVFLVRKGAS